MSHVVRAIGAGAYGQFLQALIQLATLPILLSTWDVSKTGIWFLIATIPGYLGMSDLGLTSTAVTELTFLLARGEFDEGRRLFRRMLGLTMTVALVFTGLGALFVAGVFLSGSTIQMEAVAGFFLMVAMLLAQVGSCFEGLIKASGRMAESLWVSANARLLEWLGLILGLLVTHDFVGVAACSLIFRLFATLWVMRRALNADRRTFSLQPDFHFFEPMKPLIPSSLGGLGYSLASAFSIQGSLALVAFVATPAAVTLFSAYRTVSRTLVQFAGVVSHARWADISRDFARGDANAIRHHQRLAQVTALSVVIPASVVLILMGSFIFNLWTQGRLEFQPIEAIPFLVYGVVSSMNLAPRTTVFATNMHGKLGLVLSLISLGSLVVSMFFTTFSGESGVIHGLLLGELVNFAYTYRYYSRAVTELQERNKDG